MTKRKIAALTSAFLLFSAVLAIAGAYGTLPAVVLSPAGSVTVFNAEAVTTGEASQQIQLLQLRNDIAPNLSVEILFSNTPGTFSLGLQEANTDVAGAYQALSSCTATTANSAHYARIDCPAVHANFVRLITTTQPSNSVNVTAIVTR